MSIGYRTLYAACTIIVIAKTACTFDPQQHSLMVKPTDSRLELLADGRPPVPDLLIALSEAPQPVGAVFGVVTSTGGHVLRTFEDRTSAATYYEQRPSKISPHDEMVPLDPEKIEPRLLAAVEAYESGTQASEPLEVLVTYVQDLGLPRFPGAQPGETRDSPRNIAGRARAQEIISAVEALRSPTYEALEREFAETYNAKIKDRFWLVKGVLADIPLESIRAVADRTDVQYIEYAQSDDAPPHSTDTIAAARTIIRTDDYRTFSGNWIGSLDTGVRSTHTQFNNPNRLGFVRDCVNGTNTDCTAGDSLNPEDDCHDHGTPAAGIMVGNNNLGNDLRGVTDLELDSWKVYPTSFDSATGACNGKYNATAGQRALGAAAASLDHTIMANIQNTTGFTSITSTAADMAHDTGSAIIAAAGNQGPTYGSVRSPGNAHKALAIGVFSTATWSLENSSARGPTTDARIKPDLLGPGLVHTISNTSDTGTRVSLYDGTSSATPFVAATAAAWRNFWSVSLEPGGVYAHLINIGNNTSSIPNNDIGAGTARLFTSASPGITFGAKQTITHGQTIDISLNLGCPTHVRSAIWWPESTTVHNDIDLELIRPNGTTAAASVFSSSVLEKVATSGSLPCGTWKVRIHGYSVTGTQAVFWSLRKEPT